MAEERKETTATTEPVNISNGGSSDDPFASQRSNENPFGSEDVVTDLGQSPPVGAGSPPKRDRRMSREWDASKVPPSQFQKRKGSIYATPGSRDGHVERNTQTAYTEKLKEKGWFKTK